MLKKGQRVLLKKFGWGTVLGFERFSSDGRKSFVGEQDHELSNSRVLVELDEPELWIGATKDHPHPYMMRSDILQEGPQP